MSDTLIILQDTDQKKFAMRRTPCGDTGVYAVIPMEVWPGSPEEHLQRVVSKGLVVLGRVEIPLPQVQEG